MMETKELFDWVLKQPCFEVFFCATSALHITAFVACEHVSGMHWQTVGNFFLKKKIFWYSFAENFLHAVSKQI